MKTTFSSSSGLPATRGGANSPRSARAGGFSLIEMIGVMAIMAISVAMLLPVLTQGTDSALAGQESSTMQSFATALQLNIQRNHVIPNATNWVSIVATEMGMNSNAVAFTSRGQPRYLLCDAAGFSNLPPALPYIETSLGATNPFANGTPPRFIFLSSLGQPLPAGVLGTNLFPLESDFNALWTNTPGNVPNTPPWISPNWAGKGSDLTIQRLDLAYIFAHLVLSNLDPTNATFSINGATPLNIAPTNTMNAYYLTATVLNLYMANTNLEASQVLNHDSSWVYSGGVWRNQPAPAPNVTVTNGTTGTSTGAGGAGTVTVGGCVDNDCGDCCRQFNWQRFCTNCSNPWSGKNPYTICCDFTNYMNCYQAYANSGFSSHSCRTALQNCCNQLNNDCGSLCTHNYYY